MRIHPNVLMDLGSDRQGLIDSLQGKLSGSQVKTGRILAELGPGRYQAILGGQRLALISSAPLQIGSQFSARMVSDQLVLDFSAERSEVPTDTAALEGRVTVRSLPDLLTQLGLPVDQRFLATVQGLLQAGVSLTPEAIRMFQTYAGITNPDEATLLAFMIQRAIPVDASLMMTLENLFRERKNLGKTLADLISQGESLLNRMTGTPASGKLRELLGRLRDQISQVKLSDPPQHWKEAIQESSSRSGLFREARMLMFLGGEGKDLILRDIKSLLLEMFAGKDFWDSLDSKFKSEALSLKDLIQSGINRIESSQLASIKAPWESRQIWVLEIPLWIEGQLETFQMVIEGESPESGKTLQRPIKADLYLQFSTLGKIRVSMLMTTSGIEGWIYSDTPEVVGWLNEEIPDWIDNHYEREGEAIPFSSIKVRETVQTEDLDPPLFIQSQWSSQDWPGRVDMEA